jgi:hypothetical protein
MRGLRAVIFGYEAVHNCTEGSQVDEFFNGCRSLYLEIAWTDRRRRLYLRPWWDYLLESSAVGVSSDGTQGVALLM